MIGSAEGAEQRDTIIGLLQSQVDAWSRGDADGYALNSGPDLGFTNIRGQRWVGRDEFVRIHKTILGGIYGGSRLEAEIERISFPGTDVAVAEAVLKLSGAKALPPGIAAGSDGILRTRLLEIFELRMGVWMLVLCHNTAVAG